jgi:hypothetical protein
MSPAPIEVWSSVFDYLMESRFAVDVSADASPPDRVADRSMRHALEKALAEPCRARPLSETLTSGARAVVVLPRHSESPGRVIMELLADYHDAWSTCANLDVVVLPDAPTGQTPESPDYLLPWEQAGATLHRIDLIARDGRPENTWHQVLAAMRRADIVVVVERLHSFFNAATIESALALDRLALRDATWEDFLREYFAQRIDAVLGVRSPDSEEATETGRFFVVCTVEQDDEIRFAAGVPQATLRLLRGDTQTDTIAFRFDDVQHGVVAVVDRPWSLNLEHAFCVAVALEVSLHRAMARTAPLLVALEGLHAPVGDTSALRTVWDLPRWVGARARPAVTGSNAGFDTLFDSLARGIRALGIQRPVLFVHPMLSDGDVDGVRRFSELSRGLNAWADSVPDDDSDDDAPPNVTLVHNPQNQWALFGNRERPIRPARNHT